MSDTVAQDAPPRARRSILIVPVVFIGLIFALYSGIWIWGSGIMDEQIDVFIDNEEANGNVVTYENRRIKGYPFQLRAQIEDFLWEDPGEWRWTGERLHIITLPYDISRLILVPQGPQEVVSGGVTYNATADRLFVGLEFAEQAYGAETEGMVLTYTDNQLTVGALDMNWAAPKAKEGEAPPPAWTLAMQVQQLVHVDPQDRTIGLTYLSLAAEAPPGDPSTVNIKGSEIAITDGKATTPTLLQAEGTLSLGGNGYLDGTLNVKVRDEKALLDLLVAYEAMSAAEAEQARAALGGYRTLGGDDAALPVGFRNRSIFLGPVRVGPQTPISF